MVSLQRDLKVRFYPRVGNVTSNTRFLISPAEKYTLHGQCGTHTYITLHSMTSLEYVILRIERSYMVIFFLLIITHINDHPALMI